MSTLPSQPPEVFQERRRRLAARLAGAPVMVFAGRARPRNYAANTYAYRPDSHFLYLVGCGIQQAVLVGEGDQWELYIPRDPPGAALWHGDAPTAEEIAARTGVARVHALDTLPSRLHGDADRVATVPAVDPLTRLRQGTLLGRAWALHDDDELGPAPLAAGDAALADALIELRLRHDDAAQEHLRSAAAGTHAAHLAGMAATAPGRLEHAVVAAIEAELLARGMSPAYGSIVSVHGEVLHNEGHGNTMAAGDLLLVDAGAEHHGWASDVTRTWPVSGRYSSTQRDLYQVVLAAQRAAIELVRPGVRYRDIHRHAALVLTRGLVELGILRGEPEGLVERGAHALFFPHGLGHLLGLDVHDMEDLGDRAGYAPGRARAQQFGLGYLRLDRDLAPGMLVTIEPGFYQVPAILADREICGPFDDSGALDRARLAAFADVRGIRIEDDVLCTDGPPEVLTATIPKDIEQIERLVGRGVGA